MPDCHDEVTRHKKPDWLKIKLHNSSNFGEVARIVQEHGLHTICSSGRCPNQAECWSRRTATFMILGEICTRSCKFCATATGKPLPPDPDEPQKLARSVRLMGLKHCVVTSVTRDDLPDGRSRNMGGSGTGRSPRKSGYFDRIADSRLRCAGRPDRHGDRRQTGYYRTQRRNRRPG